MVERKEYLAELVGWKDEQVIKVVTGIRRCGKSTLLAQYQDWLRVNGVTDAQIVSVNFEELEYEELLDYKKLYAYLKERLVAGRTTYIFLDEIQKVADFEKVVDSLYVKPDVDIYITGSNAYMLSGDLATLLTGRYVEIMPSMTEPSLSVWCRKHSPASRPQRSGNSGHALPPQSREFPIWKFCSAKSMRTTF